MSLGSLFFFLLFIAVIVFSYVGLRRAWAAPTRISAACVAGCMITMFGFALSQEGVVFLHAALVGLIVGGGFGIATLAVALYFQGNEMRENAKQK
jgi:hypothetical protein